MAKKRPTLDAFLTVDNETAEVKNAESNFSQSSGLVVSEEKGGAKKSVPSDMLDYQSGSKKNEPIRHMLYLPVPVYDQLQSLVFEEQRGQTKRRKTHDYLLDAIDLLFKKKGLKSIKELTGKK